MRNKLVLFVRLAVLMALPLLTGCGSGKTITLLVERVSRDTLE